MTVVGAGWGLVLALLASAATAGDCFCLEDQYHVTYYDCVEGYDDVTGGSFVLCARSVGEARQQIPGAAGMTRLPAGMGKCNPCAPQSRRRGGIRGGDDSLDDEAEVFDD